MKYMKKILPNFRGFAIEVTFFHAIIFQKCCDSVKNTQCYRFPEKYFHGYRGFGFHWLSYFLSKL